MEKIINIVIIDDEEGIRTSIKAGLEKPDNHIYTFSNGRDAIDFVSHNPVDIIVSDVKMSPIDGIEVLKRIKKINSDIPIILLTAYSSKENAELALKEGAFDYMEKPYNLPHLRLLVQRGIELKKTLQENRELKNDQYHDFIGKSSQMKKIYQMVELVAKRDSTVLITGESGTGKELIARCIHRVSERRNHPFIVVNCGAIPETLLESELYGHKKGAFTGAINDKKGLFHEADHGTILLDEISTMPLPLQIKLLRVLQEKQVRKIGETRVSPVDVRVIAATNENLSSLVEKKNFREDLFYRLSVVPIDLPPLREREGDIQELIEYFLKVENTNIKYTLDTETKKLLLDYHWPGNIRELENVIERLKILSPDGAITHDKLPESFFKSQEMPQDQPLKSYMEQQEKNYIKNMLTRHSFDKNKVAEILDISIQHLYRKIKEYGL